MFAQDRDLAWQRHPEAIRSRSGPETRDVYCSGTPGPQRQRPARCRRSRTGTGSSPRRAGSGPGTSSRDRPARSRPGRPRAAGGAPRARPARTPAARRGTGRRGRRSVTSPGESRGPPPTIAAYEHRVVRGPERRRRGRASGSAPSPATEATIVAAERLRVVERRQQARDRPREQRLAGSRRPDISRPWPPASATSSAAARLELAADLGEVRRRAAARRDDAARASAAPGAGVRLPSSTRGGRALGRRAGPAPDAASTASASVATRDDLDARRRARASSSPSAGTMTRRTPAPRERRDHRQEARHRRGPRRRATARR